MARALKHTAMIVEDDELQRELLSLIFEESDMNVIQCASAEAAVAVLDHAGGQLTLIFTNADFQGAMSGVELAAIASQRFPDIDVIVTSVERQAIPDSAMFMRKPWLPLELLRQAEQSCARH